MPCDRESCPLRCMTLLDMRIWKKLWLCNLDLIKQRGRLLAGPHSCWWHLSSLTNPGITGTRTKVISPRAQGTMGDRERVLFLFSFDKHILLLSLSVTWSKGDTKRRHCWSSSSPLSGWCLYSGHSLITTMRGFVYKCEYSRKAETITYGGFLIPDTFPDDR